MTPMDVAHWGVALVAFGLGAKLPDVDLAPLPIWRHRSMWTHGPLLPIALWLLSGNVWVWWFTVGVLPTLALHHLADCFPKHFRWRGGALVKLYPLPWSLPWWLSFLWLLAGAVASAAVWWIVINPYAQTVSHP